MKNYLSSLMPIHSEDEEQEPVLEEKETDAPYLPETKKSVPRSGPGKTIISDDIVINGSLTSSSDIDVFGTIKGDITTPGNLLIAGTVEGNVKAFELHFEHAHVVGNIVADERVVLEDNSLIEGDIDTKDFILDGSLTGNVKASGSIILKNTAVLTGDISTGSLEVAKGAVINGNISFRK